MTGNNSRPEDILTRKTMDNKPLFQNNCLWRAAAAFLFIAVFNGGQVCLAGQPGKTTPTPAELSPANVNLNQLDQIIDNARDIYERTETNRWKHLDKKVNTIIKVEQYLPGVTPEKDRLYLNNLMGVTTDLEHAVAAHDRLIAMKSANKVMILSSRLAEAHNSPVPINVAVIAYCGRKLEILSQTDSGPDLNDTVAKLHLSWQQLIPLVTANGGIKEVKRFAEVMKHLESAKAPDEYGKLAPLVVEEIEIIEKIFKK